MNEMNSLEARLKCWNPREPSAQVAARLFNHSERKRTPASRYGWMAPVAACLLLAGTLARQPVETVFPGETSRLEMVAMSLSNQNFAAYLPGSFKQKQNRWDTFEWTNRGDFNSSKHPFFRVTTDGSDQR